MDGKAQTMKHFQDCSDEQLAQFAEKDAAAMYALMLRYERWIRWKANGMCCGAIDAEDLVQEGFLGLLAAAAGFDASRGVHFAAYAAVCIVNRMRSVLRRNQHNPLPVGDAAADCFELPDCSAQPDLIVLQREQLEQFWNILVAALSEQEYQVCMLFLGGVSYQQIARQLSLTVKAVDSTLQRVRRKLRPFLIENSQKKDGPVA